MQTKPVEFGDSLSLADKIKYVILQTAPAEYLHAIKYLRIHGDPLSLAQTYVAFASLLNHNVASISRSPDSFIKYLVI